MADHIVSFLRTIAWQKGKDPHKLHLTFREWREVANRVKKRFPQASNHLRRLDKLFEQYDKDQSGTLDFGELSELLHQIDTKLTSLPATAQRANQQGEYLGRKLSKISAALPGMRANEVEYGDLDEAVYKAFKYKHLGSLAYREVSLVSFVVEGQLVLSLRLSFSTCSTRTCCTRSPGF